MCRESFLNSSNVFLHVGHLKIMAPLCPCILTMWFPKTPGFWKTLEQFVQWYFSAGAITNCSWSSVSSFGISTLMLGIGLKAKKKHCSWLQWTQYTLVALGSLESKLQMIWIRGQILYGISTPNRQKKNFHCGKNRVPLKNLVHSLWKIPPMLFILFRLKIK